MTLLSSGWGQPGERPASNWRPASIEIVDDSEATVRAQYLSAAWVYLNPQPTHGFPIHLVEAMACGVAVASIDGTIYRDLVRHNETGLLCADELALLDSVTRLAEDPNTRQRLGDAARVEASQRFGGAQFAVALLDAYAREGDRLVPPDHWVQQQA